MMEIHLAGTGTSLGVPVLLCDCPVCISKDPRDQRLRACAIVQKDNTTILIDTSPDLRQQLLKCRPKRIDAILYTHEHNDHIVGLEDTRPYYFNQQKEIPVYGLPRVINDLYNKYSYCFGKSAYPSALRLKTNEILVQNHFFINDIKIIPISVLHGQLPIVGYKIGNAAYITDASHINQENLNKLENLEVLIINALRINKHPSHFNLQKAIDIIIKIKPQRAYLTHISHTMGLYESWTKQLPKNVYGAYDGLTIDID